MSLQQRMAQHMYSAGRHLRSQCVAVCCSVLQCVAVCCSAYQLQQRMAQHMYSAGRLLSSQCVAVCCSVLQCAAVCCMAQHRHSPGRLSQKSFFRKNENSAPQCTTLKCALYICIQNSFFGKKEPSAPQCIIQMDDTADFCEVGCSGTYI